MAATPSEVIDLARSYSPSELVRPGIRQRDSTFDEFCEVVASNPLRSSYHFGPMIERVFSIHGRMVTFRPHRFTLSVVLTNKKTQFSLRLKHRQGDMEIRMEPTSTLTVQDILDVIHNAMSTL
jgi:hypothetical protein